MKIQHGNLQDVAKEWKGACMATRDNENKQHNGASLEPRKKVQVKNKQTNK